MNILETARQYKDGLEILNDWIGSGGEVVSQAHAEERSLVCLNCPENRSPLWWQKFFTNPIAIDIRKKIEIKNKAQLRVPNEDSMHVCRACGCALPLKLWTPIEHIKEHTSQHTLDKAPDFCWFKNEIKNSL